MRLAELELFERVGVLPTSAYEGKVVLDREAGDCAFSVAMLLKGAEAVVAVDSWTTADALPARVRSLPGLSFSQASIQSWEAMRLNKGAEVRSRIFEHGH